MQTASESWIESNSRPFTTQANVSLTIETPDDRMVFVSNERLFSYKHEFSGDLMSGSIAYSKITAKINNRDGVLGDGRTDAETYNNCRIIATYGFKRINGNAYDGIRGGVYYINSYDIDIDNGTVTITAVDILSLMTNVLSSPWDNEQTAFFWVETIKRQCNISNIVPVADLQIEYDDDFFREVYFVFPTTTKKTCREVLQLIAHGCKCVVYTDRQNKIHIEPLSRMMNKDYVISRSVQYTRPKLSFDNPINGMLFYINNSRAKKPEDPDMNGQNQIMENEALYAETGTLYPLELMEFYYNFFNESRVTFSGTWRADPRLDLFDTILIETEDDIEAACITYASMEFTGAWKGKYKAKSINSRGYYTTIYSLENYKISELETSKIKELEGE